MNQMLCEKFPFFLNKPIYFYEKSLVGGYLNISAIVFLFQIYPFNNLKIFCKKIKIIILR